MLGVPLHGADVAPRFCSADQFMIAELDGDQICRVHRLSIPEESWSKRLEQLSNAGVRLLLCGGFNRSYLPVAESFGIRVIVGLAGEAEQLVDAFLRDELDRHQFLPDRARCGRGRGGERPRQGSEREFSRRKGVGQCRDTTKAVR